MLWCEGSDSSIGYMHDLALKGIPEFGTADFFFFGQWIPDSSNGSEYQHLAQPGVLDLA